MEVYSPEQKETLRKYNGDFIVIKKKEAQIIDFNFEKNSVFLSWTETTKRSSRKIGNILEYIPFEDEEKTLFGLTYEKT